MCKLKLLSLPIILFAGQLKAQVTNIVGPTGSGDFGYSVTALSNGNYVITDPFIYNGLIPNAGAVYLYDGKTHALISTLKGNANDFIGRDGVIALPNGNFVILSRSVDNGSVVDCGAITWGNGSTGLSGVLSMANSLFGTATDDSLGSGDQYGQGGIVVFDNGNYAVVSPGWDNGSVINAGAVTLLSGNGPTSGIVSSANSLVGSTANDRIGSDGIFMLDNNHFIVRSFSWNNGPNVNAGAITWCNGVSLTGQVSSANSLVGTTTGDFVDDIIPYEYRIKKLTNGNFVVINRNWDDTGNGVVNAGAVTWGSNTLGLAGVINSSNSLVGSKGEEQVGGGPGLDLGGVVALSNGNYVVISPYWNDENNYGAGAVTWGNGTVGVTGVINATNSLVGSSNMNQDEVGSGGVVALSNGNYVVLSPYWSNGPGEYVGAITWVNGATGLTGAVSPANSLVGSTSFDFVWYSAFHKMVVPLTNGNYVVCTPNWDNGNIVNAGAVTWANGNTGITGEISGVRSLTGEKANDELGYVTALSNGNYVISSPHWDNGAVPNAGAVTWAEGNTGITGYVNSNNSLVGSQPDDMVGLVDYYDYVTVLNNGNYVVRSPYWDNGAVSDAGAATWGNGMTGITGPVSSSNSLVGTTSGDNAGQIVTGLINGNYVVSNPGWDNGTTEQAGAVTWGNGNAGITGPVGSNNSLVGSHTLDFVGGVLGLSNGNYLVSTSQWDNTSGPGTGKGALTWGNGLTGISGIVSISNSLVGTSPGDFQNEFYTFAGDHYILGLDRWDNGSFTNVGALTLASSSSGVAGEITSCNSIIGSSVNNGWQLRYDYNHKYGYLIVGYATHNIVRIFSPTAYAMAGSTDSAVVNINGAAPVSLISGDGCHIIATITSNGASPVNGTVKAKTWTEPVVPEYNDNPFVSRHYEITPALNATAATARVTLYFTQEDFDNFNAHPGSALNAPVDGNDAAGIANIRIGKYGGMTSSGTGLPGTYTGGFTLIDPSDNDIVWNSALLRWEISFDVTGFSGFILQTNIPLLPLTLLEFTGRFINNNGVLGWKTTDEVNTLSFVIERSIDGRSYLPAGNVAALSEPGIHAYNFTDINISSLGVPLVYYRLKLVDIDGRFTYSNIITLVIDNKKNIVLYPNPVMDNATLTITATQPEHLQARIIDNVGGVVRQQQWYSLPGNTSVPVNVSKLAAGIYFLELKGKTVNNRIQFVKL